MDESEQCSPDNDTKRGGTFYAMRPRLMLSVVTIACALLLRLLNAGELLYDEEVSYAEGFFSEGDGIVDSYDGSFADVRGAIAKSDFVLVMYYAPWSKSSQDARSPFSRVAHTLAPQIPCHAVDCFLANGECRKAFTVYRFPVFYAYASGVSNPYYYQGPHTAAHILQFIEFIRHPVAHLRTQDELTTFISQSESVVIGYFNLTTHEPWEYRQFFLAARRSLAADAFNPVKFGVVSSLDLAAGLNLTSFNTHLMTRTLDEPLYYSHAENYTATSIINWAYANRQKPLVVRIEPLFRKSSMLSSALSKGPALVLLSPSNPLAGRDQHYDMFREAALSLLACTLSSRVTSSVTLTRVTSARARLQSAASSRRLANQCEVLWERDRARQSAAATLACSQAGQSKSFNNSYNKKTLRRGKSGFVFGADSGISISGENVCPLSVRDVTPLVGSNAGIGCKSYGASPSTVHLGATSEEHRNDSDLFYAWKTSESACQSKGARGCNKDFESQGFTNSQSDSDLGTRDKGARKQTDPWVLDAQSQALRQACDELQIARLAGYAEEGSVVAPVLEERKGEQFEGLTCSTNRTIGFLAVDTHRMPDFARRLGLPTNSRHGNRDPRSTMGKYGNIGWSTNEQFLTGVDGPDEERFGGRHLASDGEAQLVIIDRESESVHTMKDPVSPNYIGKFLANFLNGSLERDRLSLQHSGLVEEHSKHSREVHVRDITADNFERVVFNSTKDVLVYHYTRSCGLCRMISHAYLSLQKYLSADSLIDIVRIEGEMNDLPWEWQAGSYPSIVLYPAHRKSESVVFPPAQKISSAANLMTFILRHSTHDHRSYVRELSPLSLSTSARDGTLGHSNSPWETALKSQACAWLMQEASLLKIMDRTKYELQDIELSVESITERAGQLLRALADRSSSVNTRGVHSGCRVRKHKRSLVGSVNGGFNYDDEGEQVRDDADFDEIYEGDKTNVDADVELDQSIGPEANGQSAHSPSGAHTVICDDNDNASPDEAEANVASGELSLLLKISSTTSVLELYIADLLEKKRVGQRKLENSKHALRILRERKAEGAGTAGQALISVLKRKGDHSFTYIQNVTSLC